MVELGSRRKLYFFHFYNNVKYHNTIKPLEPTKLSVLPNHNISFRLKDIYFFFGFLFSFDEYYYFLFDFLYDNDISFTMSSLSILVLFD